MTGFPELARRCVGGLGAAVAAWLLAASPAPAADGTSAVLQGLNKVTARVSPIEAPVDATVRFGTLEITVRACHKAPPEEPPESTVFIEIDDVKPGEQPVRLFSGWMFASSPALSALEHPVYDIWVLDCQTAAEPVLPDAPSSSSG